MGERWAFAVMGLLAGCGDEVTPCVCDVTVLASDLVGAGAVAVDATTVYWSEPDRVRAVSKTGGLATDITGVRRSDYLEWNAGRLAWVDGFTVQTWLLPQGPAITLNTEPASANYGLAIDATHATFGMQSGDLVRIPVEGGSATTLAAEVWALDVAVNETEAFFTSCQGSGRVQRVSLTGGSPVSLSADAFCPIWIAVNSQAVVWTDSHDSDPGRSHINRIGMDGGEVTTIVEQRDTGENGLHIKVDEDHLYYTTGDALWRVPVDGGDSVKLADGEIDDLALDETSVYWTDSLTGTLSKAPK